MSGVVRCVAVALLLVLHAGCSVKMAYNNAERLVRWQVSDYVDLDAQQKDYLNEQMRQLMAWHRTTQLPEYAQQVYVWSDQLTDEVTPERIADIFEQLFAWGDRVEARGLPIAQHLLRSLSDEQLAQLPERLERRNAEIEEPELDLDLQQARARWAREFEDALERFTGRLDAQQRAYIERRAQAYQPELRLWAQYRRRWQQDLLSLLGPRAEEGFAPAFAQLVAAREAYYGETYARVSEHNIALSREIAAHILSNLSARQQDRFTDSLRKLGDDFAELAAEAES